MSSPELPGRIILRSPSTRTLEMGPPSGGSLIVVPNPGPPGPQGPPGGNYFVHTQSTPAATWIINHNLAKKVHVSIFDGTETIFADIEHGSINQTTITFPGPVAGSAVIS